MKRSMVVMTHFSIPAVSPVVSVGGLKARLGDALDGLQRHPGESSFTGWWVVWASVGSERIKYISPADDLALIEAHYKPFTA